MFGGHSTAFVIVLFYAFISANIYLFAKLHCH